MPTKPETNIRNLNDERTLKLLCDVREMLDLMAPDLPGASGDRLKKRVADEITRISGEVHTRDWNRG